jgi:RNA polymerase sigma factor (sigma-70 family)
MASDTETLNTTAALLRRAHHGDARARADLVARVEPLLRRFAQARLPQHLRRSEDTGDLLQRTWLRTLEILPSIEPREPGAFFAYLRTALVNALRESLRRDARSPLEAREIDESLPFATDALPVEDWIEYEHSLARLSDAERGLVVMRFEFGMSFVEIGDELGEKADTVRVRLARTLARLAGGSRDDGKP